MGNTTGSQKIVYIEDNAANYDLVARVLRSTNRYVVLGASDGESGIELTVKEKPALVLVDLDVPGINGFEVTRQIKAHRDPEVARIPVAIVSANVMQNERDLALEAGCVAFIEKPFDIREFRALIAQLLAPDD